MCTPTRRNYKHDVVSVTPCTWTKRHSRAVCTVQACARRKRLHHRANVMQRALN